MMQTLIDLLTVLGTGLLLGLPVAVLCGMAVSGWLIWKYNHATDEEDR